MVLKFFVVLKTIFSLTIKIKYFNVEIFFFGKNFKIEGGKNTISILFFSIKLNNSYLFLFLLEC
jgi:hypothetical protein